MPNRLPKPNNKMSHQAPLPGSMPMRRSSRRPNHISRLNASRRLPLIADPAGARGDFQDLAFFVRVPVGAGVGSKDAVGEGEIEVLVEEVEIDVAGERGGWAEGLGGVGGNDCGGHFIVDLVWSF